MSTITNGAAEPRPNFAVEREQKLLDFIEKFSASNGKPPGINDMARHLGGIAQTGVSVTIKRLAEKGRIEYEKGNYNSIKVVDEGDAKPAASADAPKKRARRMKDPTPKAPRKAKAPRSPKPKKTAHVDGVEMLLAVAHFVGIGRAVELVAKERDRIQALIGRAAR